MKNLILAAALVFFATGCALRQKILDAPMVSMTYTHLPDGAKLRDMGPTNGKFCADSFNDKGAIGLFDEATKAAQNQSHADFISNASFWSEGNCVELEGNGQKIVAAAETPAAPATPAASKAPIKKMKKK